MLRLSSSTVGGVLFVRELCVARLAILVGGLLGSSFASRVWGLGGLGFRV